MTDIIAALETLLALFGGMVVIGLVGWFGGHAITSGIRRHRRLATREEVERAVYLSSRALLVIQAMALPVVAVGLLLRVASAPAVLGYALEVVIVLSAFLATRRRIRNAHR